METQVFKKHRIEKRGSIVLFTVFVLVSLSSGRMIAHISSWAITGFILFFAVIYARYESVTLYESHVEYKKLHFIIPKKKIIIAKHIQDIQTTTILPGLTRITIMTGNDTHVILQYFEQAKRLYQLLIDMVD